MGIKSASSSGQILFSLILLVIGMLFSIDVCAQMNIGGQSRKLVSSFEELEKAKQPSAIRLNGVSLALGYYQPAFDYWNDLTIWKLDGSIMPSVAVDFYHFNLFRSRIEAGYFQSSRELVREPQWGEEQLAVEMIPVSISLDLPFSLSERLRAYVGGGASVFFITNRYISPGSDRSASGNTTIFQGLIGAEYLLTRYTIALEGRYYSGNYTQTVQLHPSISPERSDVDISGPYVGANFKYLF